jgi:hypothetical protein
MMIRVLTILLFIATILLAGQVRAVERELVLVSHADSNIAPLDSRKLRRLYLGILRNDPNTSLTPIGNQSDPLIHEIFLQRIVHMSSRAYERHLLTKVFVRGNQRLKVVRNHDSLVKELQYNENSVSYMWAHKVQEVSNINIIQTIWKGNIE